MTTYRFAEASPGIAATLTEVAKASGQDRAEIVDAYIQVASSTLLPQQVGNVTVEWDGNAGRFHITIADEVCSWCDGLGTMNTRHGSDLCDVCHGTGTDQEVSA